MSCFKANKCIYSSVFSPARYCHHWYCWPRYGCHCPSGGWHCRCRTGWHHGNQSRWGSTWAGTHLHKRANSWLDQQAVAPNHDQTQVDRFTCKCTSFPKHTHQHFDRFTCKCASFPKHIRTHKHTHTHISILTDLHVNAPASQYTHTHKTSILPGLHVNAPASQYTHTQNQHWQVYV